MVDLKPTEKILGLDEQIAKNLEIIAPKEVKERSDIDDEEIMGLSVIYLWGDMLKIPALIDFADNFCKLRVSKWRLGRREMVSIASTVNEPNQKKMRSLKDLFMGSR
jgi:hypothetical protein